MCGTYALFDDPSVLWNVSVKELPAHEKPRLFRIRPTQRPPVIRRGPEGPEQLPMRWGLVPAWAKDLSIGQKLINARAETLGEKPSFKQAFARRRCVVPASGFYEWRKEGRGKQPYFIRRRDQGLLGIAGLWESWRQPDGEPLLTFTIVTCEPNELLAPIHDRMPVLLSEDGRRAWLDPDSPLETLGGLLGPSPADELEAYPVGAAISSPSYDGPDCIAPLEQKLF